MRRLLFALLLPLAACGSDSATPAADASEPAEASALADAERPDVATDPIVVRRPDGSEVEIEPADVAAAYHAAALGNVIPGSWSVEVGPAEEATFERGETPGTGTVSFFLGARPAGQGTWTVRGDTLIVTSTGPEGGVYVVETKSADALSFSAVDDPDLGALVLSRMGAE